MNNIFLLILILGCTTLVFFASLPSKEKEYWDKHFMKNLEEDE